MSGGGQRFRRVILALPCVTTLAAGLSACTSTGPSFFERLGELTLTSIAGPVNAPRTELSRAELERIPYATIAVSSDGGPRAYLVPLADNGGYLDYRDAAGNSVRMLGGAVTGLDTAGHDLEGVHFDRSDPIAHPTPLALWPAEIWREYQFAVQNLGRYVISLKCVYEPQGHETVEIVEVRFDLVRVRELCTNARRQITNTYWIDEATGFIWKSEQWLGPKIGQISVEIIRPYSG